MVVDPGHDCPLDLDITHAPLDSENHRPIEAKESECNHITGYAQVNQDRLEHQKYDDKYRRSADHTPLCIAMMREARPAIAAEKIPRLPQPQALFDHLILKRRLVRWFMALWTVK